MSPTVDVHAHVLPPLLIELASRGETRWGIDFERADDGRVMYRAKGSWSPLLQQSDVYRETPGERAARMSEIRVDLQVLSLSPSLYLYLEDRTDAISLCAEVNDAVAGFVGEAPERFQAFAFLPLEHPDAAAAELERVLGVPGFVGGVVSTHVNGRDWDHPDLLPFLEAAEGMGAPLFVHPAAVRHSQVLARHHLRNLIGNPLETTMAIAALVFGGVLDRFPGLRLCFAHGGGYSIFAAGRFDHGRRVRRELDTRTAPSDYLERIWFDCLTHDEMALRHLIDRVGAGRILLGSDDPADMGLSRPVDWLEACRPIAPAERALIMGGNVGAYLGPVAA